MARQVVVRVPVSCWLLSLLACGTLAGCSTSPHLSVKQHDAENLSRIGMAYDQATRQLGHPPQNAEQLKPFLKQHGDPETILRSSHDGLPYVVLWGRNSRATASKTMPPPILAHEQQGVNGVRYVLTVMGVMPMTDEEFQKVNLNKQS
jgi:hypothetical protein